MIIKINNIKRNFWQGLRLLSASQKYFANYYFLKKFKNLFQKDLNLLVLGIFLIGSLIRIPLIFKNINEIQGFRQSHTLFIAKSLVDYSYNPFKAGMPISGSLSPVLFEFPIYQYLIVTLNLILNDFEISGRLVSLMIFQFLCLYIFILIKNYLNIYTAIYVITIMEFCSFSLQWSTATLLDFLATFLSIATIHLLYKYLKTNTKLYLIFSALTFCCTLLIKPFVFIPYSIFFVYIIIIYRKKLKLLFFQMFTISLLPIVFWIRYTDDLKNNGLYWAQSWTSQNMRNWYFGDLNMRLDLKTNIDYLRNISEGIFGSMFTLFFIIFSVLYFGYKKRHRIAQLSILAFSTSYVILFNMYRHDYYAIALLPILALILSIYIDFVINFFKIRRTLFSSGLIIYIILSSYFSPLGMSYLVNYFNFPKIPISSTDLISYTRPTDQILLYCNNDWNPLTLYYSNRGGLIIRIPDIVPNKMTLSNNFSYLSLCDDSKKTNIKLFSNLFEINQITPLLYKIS